MSQQTGTNWSLKDIRKHGVYFRRLNLLIILRKNEVVAFVNLHPLFQVADVVAFQ